jgi:putative ABC transport system substrate-binding protein
MIRRREFVAAFGGAAAWPFAAGAQQRPTAVIGYLDPGAPDPAAKYLAALRNGLGETGFIEGRNGSIEYRFAHNVVDRLPELAADLVRRRVAVLVVTLFF